MEDEQANIQNYVQKCGHTQVVTVVSTSHKCMMHDRQVKCLAPTGATVAGGHDRNKNPI